HADPLTAQRGLGFGDSTGACRLFTDFSSGSVGVGTVQPQFLLHIAGDARVDGKLQVVSDARVAGKLAVAGGIEPADPQTTLQLRGNVEIVNKLKSPIPQEDWQPATLENNWAHYGDGCNPPAFHKDSLGIVNFRGMVKGGANSTVLFRLP